MAQRLNLECQAEQAEAREKRTEVLRPHTGLRVTSQSAGSA
jgi:hypothetical protein